jgi:hypothetical protein
MCLVALERIRCLSLLYQIIHLNIYIYRSISKWIRFPINPTRMDIHDCSIQIALFWSFICKSQKCRKFESIFLIFPTQHFLAISFFRLKKKIHTHTHTYHTHTLSTATQPHTRTHTHTITKIIVRRNNFTMNIISIPKCSLLLFFFSLPFFREEFGRLHCWVWRWPSGWSGRAVPVETAAMLDPVGSLFAHPLLLADVQQLYRWCARSRLAWNGVAPPYPT